MVEEQPELDKFGRPYPPKYMDYHVPRTAADAIVLKEVEGEHWLLMITRGKEPYKGRLGFPGGHIDYGEDPKTACLRELREECNVEGFEPELFEVRGKPERDPRYHMISIFYLVKVDANCNAIAGDDAAHAAWYKFADLLSKSPEEFTFDHHEVVKALAQRVPELNKHLN